MSEPSNPRVAIPKRLRMEVFKRDKFTCQYCGATPPAVVLQIDHVTPVSKGGTNDEVNLVTACEACNLGKGSVPLSKVPETVARRAEREREIEMQLSAYYRMVRKRRDKMEAHARRLATELHLWSEDGKMPADWLKGLMRFVDKLSPALLAMLVDTANDAVGHRPRENRFAYFAKSCWNNIRSMEADND